MAKTESHPLEIILYFNDEGRWIMTVPPRLSILVFVIFIGIIVPLCWLWTDLGISIHLLLSVRCLGVNTDMGLYWSIVCSPTCLEWRTNRKMDRKQKDLTYLWGKRLLRMSTGCPRLISWQIVNQTDRQRLDIKSNLILDCWSNLVML